MTEPLEVPGESELVDETVELLVRLLELGRPGSAERGHRLAASGLRLAGRFDVPHQFLRDLEHAARLHELGLLVERSIRKDAGPPGPDDWRYTVATTAVFGGMQAFRGVAMLVEALRENWDGSGNPGRLQRGQIPFRARILRVLVDFTWELHQAAVTGRPIGAEEAVARLTSHANTWYDPVVIGQFEAMVGGSPDLSEPPSRLVLPVAELAVGMVLAEDLCTSSGVKLLARGAVVTPRSLELILGRHQSDPVIAGAWVERQAT